MNLYEYGNIVDMQFIIKNIIKLKRLKKIS